MALLKRKSKLLAEQRKNEREAKIHALPENCSFHNAAYFCLTNCDPGRIGHHLKCPVAAFEKWIKRYRRGRDARLPGWTPAIDRGDRRA